MRKLLLALLAVSSAFAQGSVSVSAGQVGISDAPHLDGTTSTITPRTQSRYDRPLCPSLNMNFQRQPQETAIQPR